MLVKTMSSRLSQESIDQIRSVTVSDGGTATIINGRESRTKKMRTPALNHIRPGVVVRRATVDLPITIWTDRFHNQAKDLENYCRGEMKHDDGVTKDVCA